MLHPITGTHTTIACGAYGGMVVPMGVWALVMGWSMDPVPRDMDQSSNSIIMDNEI